MQKASGELGSENPRATDIRQSGDLPDISVGPDVIHDGQVFRTGADHVGPLPEEPEPAPSIPPSATPPPARTGDDELYSPQSPAGSIQEDAADIPVTDLEHDADLESSNEFQTFFIGVALRLFGSLFLSRESLIIIVYCCAGKLCPRINEKEGN